MGREATIQAEYAGRSGQAKVLLESEGLILRAALGRPHSARWDHRSRDRG